IERGTFRLHYVQKPIGYERYEITRDGDALKLSSDFDFTDRGGRVQLAATLRTTADFTPLAFKATGKSYRFVNVDSEIRVDGSDPHRRDRRPAGSLRDRRRRLGTRDRVAGRTRVAGRGDHSRGRPELRGGARGSRAGARRLRAARDA